MITALSSMLMLIAQPAEAYVNSVDSSYGTSGRASIATEMCGDAPANPNAFPIASFVANDGSTTILLERELGSAGCENRYRLARITPAGVPASAFGPEGFQEFSSAAISSVDNWAMVVDTLGRTYLISEPSSGPSLVRRYTATGVLDITYGSGGQSSLRWPNDTAGPPEYRLLEVHEDVAGRVLLSRSVAHATASGSGMSVRTVVARLNSAGRPDPTFSGDGFYAVPVALSHFGQWRFLTGQTALLSRGYLIHGIYAAGATDSGPHTYYVVSAKLDSKGRPVATYGTGGIAYTRVHPADGFADNGYSFGGFVGSGLDSKGRLLVSWGGGGPAASGGGGWGMQTVRVRTDGRLDTTFGRSGYLDSPTLNHQKCLVEQTWVVADRILVQAACGAPEVETMLGLTLTGAPWTAVNGTGVLGYWNPTTLTALHGAGDLLGVWHVIGRHLYITYPDYGTGGVVTRHWT
jgi:hypothetical protein